MKTRIKKRKKKGGRYVKLVHQNEYDSINDPLRVVRRGESRKIEYPFTRLKGRLRNRETNTTASFDANSVNPFNDKTNRGLKENYKTYIIEE